MAVHCMDVLRFLEGKVQGKVVGGILDLILIMRRKDTQMSVEEN